MSLKHIASGALAVVVAVALSTAGVVAAKSDVADAAMRGDAAAVRALLAQKADVNAPQSDGATALHWAVFRGDKALVEVLLKAGANPKAANRVGSTALWLASVNGDAAAITALLDAGADANEKLPLGRSPLMAAARTGNVAAMTALIDRGADVNAKETLRGTTPLMWAADEGHAAAIQLLVRRGADIKARSNPAVRGSGPALGKANDPRRQVAAQGAALAAGQALDLGQLNQIGGGRAGNQNQNQGRGAAAGRAGGAPAPAARAGGAGARGGGARAGGAGDAADDQGDADAGGGFFRRQEPSDGGELTPLVYAARANNLESVKVLLEAGADINQTTGYGWSPLLVATQNRYYALGKYLLEHGADPVGSSRVDLQACKLEYSIVSPK